MPNSKKPTTPRHSFPEDFFWGAAVSAHQVEGRNKNNWTRWELANAARLSNEALSAHPELRKHKVLAKQAESPANYVSGKGIDHFAKYEEDLKLASELNFNAIRISIEWSRLEPEEGLWNIAAFKYYKAYIKECRRLNMEPFVTLWHFSLPDWFEAKGGFTKFKNQKYFVRYCEKVIELLGRDIRYVLTMNEPNVYAMMSYGVGKWPPQVQSTYQRYNVYWNLINAHRASYKAIKNIDHSLKVGLAQNFTHVTLGDERLVTRLVSRTRSYQWNWFLLRRVRRELDFLGVNYYCSDRYIGSKVQNENKLTSDLGWQMTPSDIKPLLEELSKRTNVPLIITENGLADHKDENRKWWIGETLKALQKVLKKGDVRLIGYLHWSLLDNFEWAEGWWPKFGLISVDHQTGERTVKKSAQWFAKVISNIKSTPITITTDPSFGEKVVEAFKAIGYDPEAESFKLKRRFGRIS
jgi:beta-glucosidase